MQSLFNGCIDDFIAIAAPKVGKNFQIKDFHVPTIPLTEEELFKQMEAKLDWVNKIVSSMEALVSQTHSKTEKFESPFGNVSVRKETHEEMEQTIKEYKLSGKIDALKYTISHHMIRLLVMKNTLKMECSTVLSMIYSMVLQTATGSVSLRWGYY